MPLDQRDELTAAAIARLAGVGRAAVSNWRRRYPEFPRPVGGTASSPTFDRADVEAWLAKTGKADQLSTAGRTDTGTQLIADRPDIVSAHVAAGRAVADLTAAQLLAGVMASLLPPSTAGAEGPVVLDPACADGARLAAVADRFGDRVRLVGQAVDESAAATAALSLRDHPHQVRYEIHTGDSLRDDRLVSRAVDSLNKSAE